MDQLLEKNLITTKDAGEISGYTSDYLARLARSGKIVGKRIGHSWLIDKESLARFIEQQGDRKVDQARALARAREEEYRAHHSLLNRAAKTLTTPLPVPKFGITVNVFRSQALALSVALLAIVSGALATKAAVVPRLAAGAAAMAEEIVSGFDATFGDIPSRVISRIESVKISALENQPRVAAHVALASANLASSILARPDFSSLQMTLVEESSADGYALADFQSSAPFRMSNEGRQKFSEPLSLEDLASDAYAFVTEPSRIIDPIMRVHASLGEHAYTAITDSFDAYHSLIASSGARALAIAASTRDLAAQAPHAISTMNLALGNSIISSAHVLVRAEVATVYGLAAAAPESARATVALLGGIGDALSGAAARVPALATTAFLRAAAAPARLGPGIAQAVFDAEYAGAVHFVAAAHAATGGYLAFVEGTGTLAYDGVSGARSLVRSASSLAARAPAAFEDAYLGALGRGALAVETVARVPKVAAVLSAVRTTSAPVLAAVAPTLSVVERVAVATYETIRGFIDSTQRSLASLFAPPPTIVLPTGVPKPRVITVGASPTPAGPNSYPTYTTVVRGVSEDFVNQSLSSLRNQVLATVAGMIQPVATQTVTNAATIQRVNMIQDLSNLIVRNGDFRGGIFDNGIRVNATDGRFTNLIGGTTELGATTISGNLSVSGSISPSTISAGTSISAPYFVATSTTATSTFAGSFAIDTDGFVYATSTGNVGIGVLSPAALLDIQNSTSTQPIFVAKNAAGTEVYRLTNAGFVGIGTTTPGYNLAVEGSSSLGNQASAGYFTATSTTATSTFAGRLAVGTSTPWGDGLFTIGTTTPLLYISNNTGRIGIGTSSPAVALDVFATNAIRLPVGTTGQRPGTGDVGFVRYNTTTHQFEGYGDNAVWQGLGGVIDADQDTYITADTSNADEDTLRFFTFGSERLTIGSTGNAGIGTTSPFASLQIATTTGKNLVLSDTGAGANAKHWLFSSLGGNFYLGTTTDAYATSSASRFSILSNGRFGFGTSSPAVALDIFGSDALRVPVGTTGQRPGTGDVGFVRYNTTTHQFEGYGDNAVWQGLGGVIDADQDTYITADTSNADEDTLRFFTFGSQRLTITSAGNIGVASTSPFAKFAVHANNGETNTALFTIASSTASATSTLFSISNTGAISATGAITSTAATANIFPYASTTQLSAYNSIAVGGTATTTIAGDYSTSTFRGPLAVYGNTTSGVASSLVLQRGSTNGNNTITFNDQTGTSLLRIYTDANTGNARIVGDQSNLTLGTLVGGTALSIDTSNNVNTTAHIIPTANQTYDLGSTAQYWRNFYVNNIVANNLSSASTSIAGTNNTSFSINSNNPTTDTQDMSLIFYRGAGAPSNAVLSWNSTLKRFEFNQNAYIANATASTGSTTLRVAAVSGQTGSLTSWLDSSGNVLSTVTAAGNLGVGTSSPSRTLSVQGNSYVSGTGFFGSTLTATSSAYLATAGGSVGIGTTTPGSLLHLSKATAADADLRFESQTYNWVMGIDNSDGGKFKISSSTALGTNDRFVISGSGDVGLGTSSPSVALDIASNKTGINIWAATGANFKKASIGYSSAVASDVFTISTDANAGGTYQDIQIVPHNNSGYTGLYMNTSGQAGLGYTSFDTSIGTAFMVNGRVGIGTSTPGGPLSVTTNGRASGDLRYGLAIVNSDNATTQATNIGFFGKGGSGGNKWVIGTDVNHDNSNNFFIATSSGAGVTAPFIVNGDSTIQFANLAAAPTNTSLRLYQVNGALWFDSTQLTGGTAANYWSRSGSSVYSTTLSDSYGVGSTSPFAKFVIHANNGGTNTTLFAIASSTASATTTLFSISNTGDVAINNTGTTTIAGFLDVNGTGTNATSTYASNLWVKGTLKIGTGSTYITTDGIANSGALTLTSGGSNQNVNITPSGTGVVSIAGTLSSTGNLTLKAAGSTTGSSGNGSIYFANSSGTTVARLETTATSNVGGIATTTAGTGRDGAVSITGSTNCATTATASGRISPDCIAVRLADGSAASGQKVIQVASSSIPTAGYAVGDEVMLAQMIGSGAGNYEFKHVVAVASSTITVDSNLANSYLQGSFSPDTGSSLTTGLVAYWPLDEASGTRYDMKGSNYLAPTNSPTSTGGKSGNAAAFASASSQYLQSLTPPIASGNFTFAAWVYEKSTATTNRMFISQGTTGGGINSLGLNSDGTKFHWSVNENNTVSLSTTAVSNGTWYFVVGTYDGTNQRLYINGTLEDTDAVTATYGSTRINIGAGANPNLYWDGAVDEVGIWSKALSSQEITDLYNSGSANHYPQNSAQLVRVPNYTEVSIGGSGTLTTNAWNGITGGILALRSQNRISIASGGIIDGNSLGFWGGGGGLGGTGGTGGSGFTAGSNGSAGGAGFGSGGGGAPTAGGGGPINNSIGGGSGGGGAGGAYGATSSAGSAGSIGGTGGSSSNSGGTAGSAGSAGSSHGAANLSSIFLGSGGAGGAGGGGGAGGNLITGATSGAGGGGGDGGGGGAGGGIIFIETPLLNNSGTIRAGGTSANNGSNGSNGTAGGNGSSNGGYGGGGGAGGGGGGAGSGGSVYIKASSVTSGTITASGGSAGTGGTGGAGGNGGNCAGGTTPGIGGGGGGGSTGGSGGAAGSTCGGPSAASGNSGATNANSGSAGSVGRIRVDSAAGTGVSTTPSANQNVYSASTGNSYGTFYVGTTNTFSSDVAEYYPTGDTSIEAGDIVTVQANSGGYGLVKASLTSDSPPIGIISTNPGLLLGSSDGGNAGDRKVALAGRVPVKVTNENGPINVGDRISLSSTLGMGMKAAPFTQIVGIALENFNYATATPATGTSTPSYETGSITAFVNLSYQRADTGVSLASLAAGMTATTTLTNVAYLFASTTVTDTLYASTVNADTLCIGGNCKTAWPTSPDLSGYALLTDIPSSANFVSTSTLASTLSGYATTASLEGYATTASLAGYATAANLAAATSSLASLDTRVTTLENAGYLTSSSLAPFVSTTTLATTLIPYVQFSDLASTTAGTLSGTITGNLIPNVSNAYAIGSMTNKLSHIYAQNVIAGDLGFSETTSAVSGSTLVAGDVLALYVSATGGSCTGGQNGTCTIPIDFRTAINTAAYGANNLFFNTSGSLAIGIASTTAPRGKLDVEGSIASGDARYLTLSNTSGANGNAALAYSMYIPSTTGDLNFASNDNNGALINTSYSAWNLKLGGQTDTFSIQRSPTASLSYANLFNIASSGNVGIGSSTPWANLSIAGSSAYTGKPLFAVSSSTPTATTTAFLITSQGSVGIGTTSPSSLLSVQGNAYVSGTAFFGGTITSSSTLSISGSTSLTYASTTNISSSQGAWFATSGGSVGIGTTSPTALLGLQGAIGVNSSQLYLAASGNVGFGTTTPNWNLQVAGTRPSFALSDSSASANSKHWLFSSMGGNLYIGTSTDAYATSTPSTLTLLNNGYVGIGTSSPSTLLSVAGVIYATGGLRLSDGVLTSSVTPLPKGYISGFTLQNSGDDTNNDIIVNPGSARDTSYSDAWSVDTGSTLSTSLVAYWKMDEANGCRKDTKTWFDACATRAAPTSVAGKVGNAGSFASASSQYLAVPAATDLQLGNVSATFAGWVNLTTKAATQYLFTQYGPTNSTDQFAIYYDNTADRFKFIWFTDGAGGATTVTASTFGAPSAGTWYFVVAYHDVVGNTIGISVNNGTVDTAAATGGNSNTYAWGFGAQEVGGTGTPSNFANAALDEWGAWRKVLSAQERTDLYNSGNGNTLTRTYSDSTNITLSSALTKRLDAVWSVGTGNGCMDSGSEAASTWYHVFAIKRSDTGVVDAICSATSTSPVMPASYDSYRRIGSIRNDGSSNILAFKQDGDYFRLTTSILDVNASNPGTNAVARTLTVPIGIKTEPIATFFLQDTAASNGTYASDLDQNDQAPSNSAAPLTFGGLAAAANATVSNPGPTMRTSRSGQVRTREMDSADAGHNLRIATFGWIDARGKDGTP